MAELAPDACMPCRGTGQVISNLGGSAKLLPCPWCQGGGRRLAGVDAQAAWLGREAAGGGGEDAGEEAGEDGAESPADVLA
jgi:hypothetical protein